MSAVLCCWCGPQLGLPACLQAPHQRSCPHPSQLTGRRRARCCCGFSPSGEATTSRCCRQSPLAALALSDWIVPKLNALCIRGLCSELVKQQLPLVSSHRGWGDSQEVSVHQNAGVCVHNMISLQQSQQRPNTSLHSSLLGPLHPQHVVCVLLFIWWRLHVVMRQVWVPALACIRTCWATATQTAGLLLCTRACCKGNLGTKKGLVMAHYPAQSWERHTGWFQAVLAQQRLATVSVHACAAVSCRLEEYAKRGSEPDSELQIYTWPDATLRELAELIKDVRKDACRR